MSVIAFVPARCGSKSIRLKNIRSFCGQPLIYWCLSSLQQAQRVDQIIVATDCQEISSCVEQFNLSKVCIYKRSKDNAKDGSSTEDVMLEYLNSQDPDEEDLLLLVQATSPFCTPQDFDHGISKLQEEPFDSLLSCSRLKRFLWDELGNPLNYRYQDRPRRQDFPGTLIENGAFYLNTVRNILSSKNRLSGNIGIYEMPAFAALELDEEDDWVYGEYLMRKYIGLKRPTPSVRLFLSDVDGVLTDAGMYYTENGDEIKKFNTYDGMGFLLMKKQGIKVGIITREDRQLNRKRAEKLGLDYHFHGVLDKLTLVKNLCDDIGIGLEDVAYIGDDINDKELLEAVGTAACPSNATASIAAIPGIIKISKAGGDGAVRQFAEFLLGVSSK